MYAKTAPWDKFVFYTTWITLISSSIICILVILLLQNEAIEIRIRSYCIFSLVVLLFLIIYLFSPKSYLIASEGIKINKVFGSNFVPGTEIKHAEIIPEANIIRSFGSGGFFGYFGTFYESNEAKAIVYCTRLKNVVRIEGSQVTYYISPDVPDSFLKKLIEVYIKEGN